MFIAVLAMVIGIGSIVYSVATEPVYVVATVSLIWAAVIFATISRQE